VVPEAAGSNPVFHPKQKQLFDFQIVAFFIIKSIKSCDTNISN